MADRISKETRSKIMSRIRPRNTKPEMLLRRALWASGLRYRVKGYSSLPGKPDIIFPKQKIAIFVDGCFWHGCPIHGHIPKSREEYWSHKIERNKNRDIEADTRLSEMGWHVMRLWEHCLRKDFSQCVNEIKKAIIDNLR